MESNEIFVPSRERKAAEDNSISLSEGIPKLPVPALEEGGEGSGAVPFLHPRIGNRNRGIEADRRERRMGRVRGGGKSRRPKTVGWKKKKGIRTIRPGSGISSG